jgi:hypothetical protein
VNRVATAIERRGVVATYELHDRVLANASARRRLAESEPTLGLTQQRILDELRDEGYSLLSFPDLFPEPYVWSTLDASAQAFIERTEAGLEHEAAAGTIDPALSRRPGKEFVVRRYPYGVTLGLDDPWLAVAADRRMLDIANAYHGMWSKLEYVDLWYTPPVPTATERRVSQNWHRDYNDRHLLKCFVYLVDVDEETGPFEFVPGSEPGGVYGRLWPWEPAGPAYPPLDEFESRGAGLPVRTFTGPKATMLFCNTAGLHRGGFATGKARVLATFTYDSAAALKALTRRNFRFQRSNGGPVDEVVRYALD